MRRLTFKSFLASYLKDLSETHSCAPTRLVHELDTNRRLVEPLCLYMTYVCDETQRRSICAKAPVIGYEFRDHEFLHYNNCDMERFLDAESNGADPYRKCWVSYVSERDRKLTEMKTKELMIKEIRSLQSLRGVTNYRIYTDLGLNPGNINAFLTHGDCSKVSLDTARTILKYLQ